MLFRRGVPLALLAALAVLPPTAAGAAAAISTSPERVEVIVRHEPGAHAEAIDAFEGLGGRVERRLAMIDAFAGEVPAAAIPELSHQPGVLAVTVDSPVRLAGDDDGFEWKSDTDQGSLYSVTKSLGVHDAWSMSDVQGRKITGKDIGIALIDSGIVPVKGLDDPTRVVNGPDLSFESQADDLRHLDTYGHGTHLAGIIAGRDPEVQDGNENDSKYFVGVAPDARLINVKVASADGATDVSQVIAAIDWVVQHRNDPGLNIRVLNLSFGTNSMQSAELDPLAYAVEVAWRRGIVVVVAAGNDGPTTDRLSNPAIDPYVIAVGAADHRGTERREDDIVATFSSRGSVTRTPDLVAPGRSIASLRNPGSFIDQQNPLAMVTGDTRLFRGSGTSQAAAVVSGSAALLLQHRPSLTPDQVKSLLVGTAYPIRNTDPRLQGAGLLDVDAAIERPTPPVILATQLHPLATGLGSLELARGDAHVADDGVELTGEQDIFGQAWDGRTWSEAAWEGRSWTGGDWNGSTWTGTTWEGTSWTGRTWSARTWTGRTWSGRTWSATTWAGRSWTGRSWTGRSWTTWIDWSTIL